MNKSLIVGLLVAAVAAGAVGSLALRASAPLLGGDFAGGISSIPLHTASASGGLTGNGYIQPVGSFVDAATNGLSVGGSDQYHGFSVYETASGSTPSAVTLNAFGNSTGTAATTSITLSETNGLAVGDICSGGIATTSVFVSGCWLTATDGVTGTAMAVYANGTNASVSVPTSTVVRISFEHLPY